jgi:hypothetical protein
MGMFRDSDALDADLIKEMAEGLGSQGLRIEEILLKIKELQNRLEMMTGVVLDGPNGEGSRRLSMVNDIISEHNELVDNAKDALRWLLIQREACGFRTHRNVSAHYPIPDKIRLLKP